MQGSLVGLGNGYMPDWRCQKAEADRGQQVPILSCCEVLCDQPFHIIWFHRKEERGKSEKKEFTAEGLHRAISVPLSDKTEDDRVIVPYTHFASLKKNKHTKLSPQATTRFQNPRVTDVFLTPHSHPRETFRRASGAFIFLCIFTLSLKQFSLPRSSAVEFFIGFKVSEG